jgi:hypothetical protein
MLKQFNRILCKKYPQNYILKNPFFGILIFLAFCLGFLIIYKPLNAHASKSFSYPATMAVYCLSFSACIFGFIKVLKKLKYFSDNEEWTFCKELIFIFLTLSLMGTAIYFLGFIIEIPSGRWNLETFLDSYKAGFLIGLIPLGFFTLSNFRHLLIDEKVQNYGSAELAQHSEELVQISSTLKKEELSFYPGQFIYAESDSNYVVFYLDDNQHLRKEIIRNSISSIEQQLEKIPFIIRTHRAFIVNLKKVRSKNGSSLGYRLKLVGTDSEIPVSRPNVHLFDELLKKYR